MESLFNKNASLRLATLLKGDSNIGVFLWNQKYINAKRFLKGKLYNNKYMIASTQIRNTEKLLVILTLRVTLVFTLVSRKVLFINRKDNRNC